MSLRVNSYEIRSPLVLGYGRTGHAVTHFFLERGVVPSVSEAGRLSEAARDHLRSHGISFEEDGHSEHFVEAADAVILSPGVPMRHAAVILAQCHGIPVFSEIDLASQMVSTPIVAVTGTNGKGTTVMLVAQILEEAGRSVCVGGNIGTPFISIVHEAENSDLAVLELSSYQLAHLSEGARMPEVAVVTNFTANHLDWHGSLGA